MWEWRDGVGMEGRRMDLSLISHLCQIFINRGTYIMKNEKGIEKRKAVY